MGRRVKGLGSVFQDKKTGKWRGFVTVGYTPDGQQIKRWRYGKTQSEVTGKLKQILHLSSSRIVNAPQSYTVEDALNQWAEIKASGCRPQTRVSHRFHISKIVKHLGRVRITALDRRHVQQLYKRLAEDGLAPSTRRKAHHILKAALSEAVNHNLIDKNPAVDVQVPPGEAKIKSKAWEPHQVTKFLEVAKSDRYYALFYLSLTLGLRPGEVFALKWSDFDASAKLLTIDETLGALDKQLNPRPTLGPTKTERSNRQIALSDEAITILLEHKTRQEQERVKSKFRWQNLGFMFVGLKGKPIRSSNFIRRTYRKLVEKADVPYIRLHDHRHTYITLARDAGIDLEVVAQRVGQDPKVTASIYSKITMSRQRKAAKTLSELLGNNSTPHSTPY
jgi:integrase